MILTVEPGGEVALYQQLRDQIVEAIASGQLKAGDSLPATRQLAADLGINMHTVNKAYDLLRQEGLVRLGRRSGAVVLRDPDSGPAAPDVAKEWTTRAHTLLAEAHAKGVPPPEVLEYCRSILAGFSAGATEPNLC